MEIIFKEDQFESYIEEFLPFIDRDTKYSYLKPHIITAEKELIKIVGSTTFAIAEHAFSKDMPTALEKDILYHFRLPILLLAYKIYAPTNDLRHGNNGRKMTNKEDEKNPFEWMINRDNENLERSYYRELDNLIYFLDQFNVWRESDTYKKMRSLFIHSTSIFDNHFPINSRLLLLKLQPGLKQAERKHIIPVIGKPLFDKLKSFILQSEVQSLKYYPAEPPTSLPEPQESEIQLEPLEKEILELCEEATVYYGLAWAMKRLKVTLFPEGLLQSYIGDRNTAKARKTPENLETQLAAQEFTKDAEDVLLLLQNSIAEMQTKSTTEVTDLSGFQLYSDFQNNEDDNFASI